MSVGIALPTLTFCRTSTLFVGCAEINGMPKKKKNLQMNSLKVEHIGTTYFGPNKVIPF